VPGKSGVTLRVVVKRNDLPKVPHAIHQAVAAEVTKGGYEIEAAAKQKAPVRTGTLRRSIHTVLTNGGMTATVGPSVRYGFFVEFGTRHAGARPFLRPAYAIVAPRVVDRIKTALRGRP